jgi:hypothetical protein
MQLIGLDGQRGNWRDGKVYWYYFYRVLRAACSRLSRRLVDEEIRNFQNSHMKCTVCSCRAMVSLINAERVQASTREISGVICMMMMMVLMVESDR